MKSQRKPIFLVLIACMALCLIASDCNGPSTAEVEEVETGCHGSVYVVKTTVKRVTPAPSTTYSASQTYSWDEPPYGIEVTSGGEAVLRIYDAANSLRAKFTIYAATTSSDLSVKEWNGLKEIALNAGNYVIEDSGGQDICDIGLLAGGDGVSLESLSTKYVVTVRPEIGEVIVAVLEGKVKVTDRDFTTVILDPTVPDQSLVVIRNQIIDFDSLQAIPDPDLLLEEVMQGQDIPLITPPDSLTLWVDDRLLPVLQEIAASFTYETGIPVSIEGIRASMDGIPLQNIRDKYLLALQSGNAPDLVTLHHQTIYELIMEGYLLSVEQVIPRELLVTGTSQAFSYQGRAYGIPYVYENLALISNPEIIPQVPTSWNELMSYTEEFSAGQEFHTLMIPASGYFYYPLQSAFGGYIFGTTADGTFTRDDLGMGSDGTLNAAAYFEALSNLQPQFAGDENEALENFRNWNAAMIVAGPWRLQQLREMGIPFQVNRFPSQVNASHPFLGVYGFVISRNTSAPDQALNFLANYLTTYGATRAYSLELGLPPARRDALENLEDDDLRAFGFAGVNGSPIPYLPEMQFVWQPWDDAIREIIYHKLSGFEAFLNATEIISSQIYP